ncbi:MULTISPECIES: hypothetical protein [unclassified Kitasatospora]|uniref:hypothetical protein n=1 Tax=unclassified Kitasatospora TaxID=2633591 RepID=UPI002474AB83|nr:hypothetical protein [Kitasatospora sp. MAP12-44]
MTVEISGIMEPAAFEQLLDALAAAWGALLLLPLKGYEHNWLECMLTAPEAELRALESIERYGVWEMPLSVGGSLHELCMRRTFQGISSVQCEEEQLLPGNRATSPDPR